MSKFNTKTITLTGSELEVKINGQNCDIRNDSADMVYAAGEPNISAGADGVMAVPAGHAVKLLGVDGRLYLLGTGSVQICGNDYSDAVFKCAPAAGGGEDSVARTAINAHVSNSDIHITAEEREEWNGKAEKSDIPAALPADGGNADTINGLSAENIITNSHTAQEITSGIDLNTLYIDANEKGLMKEYYARSNGQAAICTNKPATVVDVPFRLFVFSIRALTETDYTCLQIYIDTYGDMYKRMHDCGNWLDWGNIADGGNAATLNGYADTDFVLKSEYDALAARITALENGTI